jgi:hypothetical protein
MRQAGQIPESRAQTAKYAKLAKMTWTHKGGLTNGADGTIKIFADPLIQAKNTT